MTIAELRTCPPQTSQYLDAQLLSIGLAKIVNTQRGQRYVQELQVVDRQGQQEKIAYWFDADKPDFAMPLQQINQWLQWKVKTKPNGQYLNISGYPEKAATPAPPATQQGQQSYTSQPQAARPAPQKQPYRCEGVPAPQNQRVPSEWDKPIDWHDKKQLYIIRQSSISNAIACLKVSDTETVTVEQVLSIAKRFARFVYDGIAPDDFSTGGGANPEYSENPPPPAPGDKF